MKFLGIAFLSLLANFNMAQAICGGQPVCAGAIIFDLGSNFKGQVSNIDGDVIFFNNLEMPGNRGMTTSVNCQVKDNSMCVSAQSSYNPARYESYAASPSTAISSGIQHRRLNVQKKYNLVIGSAYPASNAGLISGLLLQKCQRVVEEFERNNHVTVLNYDIRETSVSSDGQTIMLGCDAEYLPR